MDVDERRVAHASEQGASAVREVEPAPVLQWVGLALAPLAFAAHLQIGYVLVPWACTTNGRVWIHVVGVASVLLAIAGTVAAWTTWMRAGREEPGEGGGSMPRTRFLGATGLGFSAMLVLILFAQWIAAFFIDVCQ
jgi:hypothetical protein